MLFVVSKAGSLKPARQGVKRDPEALQLLQPHMDLQMMRVPGALLCAGIAALI